MKKVICAVCSLLTVCGTAYIAYKEGKNKGYSEGLRFAEEQLEASGLEAEGEATETSEGFEDDVSDAESRVDKNPKFFKIEPFAE